MTGTLLKSSSNNRLDAIMQALTRASDMAVEHSDMPLSRMPEYFMAVHVANHFADSFSNFGYRLEASVKDTLLDAGVSEGDINDLLENERLRGNGRFDLVLRTGRRGVPAHVVEFKRGSRNSHLYKDLVRLSYVSNTVRDDQRLVTNYLVFTTKKTEGGLRNMLASQEAEHRAEFPRARGRTSYELKRYETVPHWAKDDAKHEEKHMAVAVFEVKYKV
ncbi:hypothetical protein [Pseudomonas sp. ATCC PTA-122608]|uniref:hypothetical protein n=1 Tax=Pseudomonas sp. ATCC PTA-122608 TaxID=1771311 RepID=UPI00117A8FF0|nr:hypothetical protein [Pseudomonas sp. ATCC PTA-122608]